MAILAHPLGLSVARLTGEDNPAYVIGMSEAILKKIESLNRQHGFGLDSSELKKVSAALETQASGLHGEEMWLRAFELAIIGVHQNPLKADIDKKDREINKICPICQEAGVSVTLLGGRKAFFCDTHKVVQPAVVKKD